MIKKHDFNEVLLEVFMPRLTKRMQTEAIHILGTGSSQRPVARGFNYHPSTLSQSEKSNQQAYTVKDCLRPRQLHITAQRQGAAVGILQLINYFRSITVAASRLP